MNIERPMFPLQRPTRRAFVSVLAVALPAIAIAPAALAAKPDPVFALIETHRSACVAHLAALAEQSRLERLHDRDADWIAEEPGHAEWRSFETLIDTPPVTFPGLVAWATYLGKVRREDPWKFDDEPATNLITTLVHALENLAVQS